MTIITYPNPILRQKTSDIDVSKFGKSSLRELGKDMIKTMYKARGVGLAAPQIGENIRLAVIAKETSDRYPGEDLNLKQNIILINPYIIAHSVETDTLEEGCLSLPGVLVDVERSVWIKVRADDFRNRPYDFQARGFFARVVQHEVDHLDGVLIIDKKVL
ncbi:MAG: Peptide deformylase [Parcubacteria group bacterium GW2011_GWF2_44_17]|nr:MAG: Peptide deformylase [Parcubacteria group bacterium GW2011_GWF2_44_17]